MTESQTVICDNTPEWVGDPGLQVGDLIDLYLSDRTWVPLWWPLPWPSKWSQRKTPSICRVTEVSENGFGIEPQGGPQGAI
jgi:hypothetical protein